MESDKQILTRLQEEIKQMEEAKKKCASLAQRSFESWSKDNIAMVGRSNGFHIKMAKDKILKIWKWLTD